MTIQLKDAARYERKPHPITAIEFTPAIAKELPQRLVRLHLLGKWQVWNDIAQSWLTIEPGDFLRVDHERDLRPIRRSHFLNHYTRTEG